MFYGNFKEGDQERLYEALDVLNSICGPMFAGDNLVCMQRSAGFRKETKFNEAMQRHAQTRKDWSLVWRIHTLCWAAKNALHVEGDFVECGVWKALCSSVLTDYLDFGSIDRTYYMYDTFFGIPDSLNSENRNNGAYEREIADDPDKIYNLVMDKFKAFSNVEIVRGIVPDTFQIACPDKIAFLHIDMNSKASEMAALNVLYERVVPGGMIVLDDYGWTGYAAQREAEEAFMTERGQPILELPTGQGLILKQ